MENEQLHFKLTPKIEKVLDEKIEYYKNEFEKYKNEWESVTKYLSENTVFIDLKHQKNFEYSLKQKSRPYIKLIIVDIEVLLIILTHIKVEKINPLTESNLDIIYNGSNSLESNLTLLDGVLKTRCEKDN